MTDNDLHQMGPKRPIAFWVMIVFMGLSVPILMLGQTIAVFNYELTANLGLQEDVTEVSEFGVQVNRAFGVSDTIIYIPLIILSIFGLKTKRRWALYTSAAVMGISLYWTITVSFIFEFLKSVPNYSHVPGLEIWLFIGSFSVFGLWGLCYIIVNGEKLIR